jgi:hypothetical protein
LQELADSYDRSIFHHTPQHPRRMSSTRAGEKGKRHVFSFQETSSVLRRIGLQRRVRNSRSQLKSFAFRISGISAGEFRLAVSSSVR